MALAIANIDSQSEDVFGRHVVRIVEVTFDDSYPAGGESFTPASVGMSSFSVVLVSNDVSAPYQVTYDYADELLVVNGVEQDADAATTDPFDEADDTADLTDVIVRIVCIGH